VLLHAALVRERGTLSVPGNRAEVRQVRRVARVGVAGNLAVAQERIPSLVLSEPLAALVPVDLLERPGAARRARGGRRARQERVEVVRADAREELSCAWGNERPKVRRGRRGNERPEWVPTREMPNRARGGRAGVPCRTRLGASRRRGARRSTPALWLTPWPRSSEPQARPRRDARVARERVPLSFGICSSKTRLPERESVALLIVLRRRTRNRTLSARHSARRGCTVRARAARPR
jgi:hypothetical protein